MAKMMRVSISLAAALLLCCSAALCLAAPANPWETGQKTCYDAAGGVIACAGTAQDADLKPGVPWPNPRFTNNGNGTVTDNLTGLAWLKNANCFGMQTWDAALASANTLKGDNTQCSLNDGSIAGDWRLPNRKELFSLVDFEYSNPAISNTPGTGQWTAGDPFDNIQSYYYWSSSTSAFSTGYAWDVYMVDGDVYNFYNKTNYYCVWPVRGGQVDHLTLLTLKGGEAVAAGTQATISWKYQGSNISTVNIDLYKGGSLYEAIATGLPVAAGTYSWNIPIPHVSGVDFQVRLSDSANASNYAQGASFSITRPACKTTVSNNVTTNTTWFKANSPYCLPTIKGILPGIQLTIEPGVLVLFSTGANLTNGGALVAIGTAADPITFTSNVLATAPGDWGGIIFSSTAIGTTDDGIGNYVSGSILKNVEVSYSGGIQNPNAAIPLWVQDSNVSYNTSSGIVNYGNSRIERNTIKNNTSSSDGGGIYNTGNSIINGNTITGNASARATTGNGGGLYNTGLSTISNNTITNNTSGLYPSYGSGAGIYSAGLSTIRGNNIANNNALYGSGGGIYDSAGSTLDSNAITGNNAYSRAGAIVASNNTPITNNAINQNSDNGIFAGTSSTITGNTVIGNSGTGIISSSSTISNNTVTDNTGDGIQGDSSTITFNRSNKNGGKGIITGGSSIGNNTVRNNTGQGVYSTGTSNITNNIIKCNQSSGIYNTGSSTITGNIITENSSPTLSAINNTGFATINNNSVIQNSTLYGIDTVNLSSFTQNNINNYNRTGPYDLYYNSTVNQTATNNYWGTTVDAEISAKIYDWYDAYPAAWGIVTYAPFSSTAFSLPISDTSTGCITTPPNPGPVTAYNTEYAGFVDSPFDLMTTFTEQDSPVTFCEYTVDNGANWLPAAVSGAGPAYTCTKTGITGTNGQMLTLNMRAYSANGLGTGVAVAKTVDTVPPAFTWAAPAPGTMYKPGTTLFVDMPITELGSSILDNTDCNLRIDGGTAGFTGTVNFSILTRRCTGSITLGALTDAAHAMTLRVADNVGNTGNTSGSITINSGCNYTAGSPGTNYNPNGGSNSVNVTASNGCAWSADTPDSWISFGSGSSGTSNGSFNYTVSANATVTPRTGHIYLGNQVITINQEGRVPHTLTVNADGNGTGSVSAVANSTTYISYTYPSITTGATPTLDYGTSINISAITTSGSRYVWGNACAGNASPCAVTLDADKTVTVTFTSNADFTGLPITGFAPLLVNFTDYSLNSPTSWLWNFGDSATGNNQNPSHVYRNPGTYSVTLTATNAGVPAVLTKTGYIQVNACTGYTKALRSGVPDDSIQVLYNSGPSGDIIESQATVFPGGLTLDQNKVMTLKGGYDCGFNSVIDYSVIQGTVTVGGAGSGVGMVIVDGIAIE